MVIGQDVVVTILWLVVRQVGSVVGKLWSHLNRAKFLEEELIVVCAHHKQFVHKAIHWDRRVFL